MWTFLKAEVTFPILGVDFLRANRLSVSVATNQLVDDSTGDTFRLIEQPSSHTAFVMLPVNVQKEWDRPARPTAASPLVGLGATYAAAAACGTIHQSADPATPRGDFTFTRNSPPPAAVPTGVDSGRGAANSTPSPLHLQLPPPLGGQAGMAAPASIGEVLAIFQDVLNPKGGHGGAGLHRGGFSHFPGRPQPKGRPAANDRQCGTPPPDKGGRPSPPSSGGWTARN